MQEADPRSIPAREIALVSLGAVLLACVVHWPLPMHLADAFPRDLGDPIVQAWQVAWGGHALIHQPLDFFQANQYWPLQDTLAFSDALIGYAPAGLVGRGVEATTIRYNLLFLFAYALAFLGAYLLAREFKLRPAAAAVAGAAFAYAPWRLEQDGHLHVISSGGIPLALFLLIRGYRRGSVKTVIAGWVVAAWQVSLGFTLGLQLGYLLAFLGVLAAIAVWRGGREQLPPRRILVATAVGGLILLVTAVTLALPYQRVLSEHPEAERSLERVASGSGPLWSYLSAPENSVLWGAATDSIRHEHLTSIAEQTLFPGLTILALVILGLATPEFSRRMRIGLGLGALVLILLSLGVRSSGFGQYLPYRALFEFAPGWQGVRTPGRLNTLTSLIFALLAAAGAAWLLDRFTRRTALAVGGVLVALIAFEFAGDVLPDAPPEPAGARSAIAQPQLHLPITIAANRRYVYWSTNGFPKIVNGRASIDPASFTKLTAEVSGFPDKRSVAALAALGVRSVVLHPYLLVGTRWSQAGVKAIDDLGISRRVQGDLIIYDLAVPARERGALRK
ncbi:MAG: hypothetical protein JHC98_07855 [Thermoleophilaceae bacterium]|nr:hypothetical protein [Thermoleophilaceae bacterium]